MEVFMAKIWPLMAKWRFQRKHAHIFFLWTVFSKTRTKNLRYSRVFWTKNLKTSGGIHLNRGILGGVGGLTPGWALGPLLRPPLRASRSVPASAPALVPSAAPESFQFIFLSGFMKPPKVSIFPAKNIRETTETIKNIKETRSQKYAWFLFNTN